MPEDASFPRVVPATDPAPAAGRPGRLVRLAFGLLHVAPGADGSGGGLVELCRSARSPWELMGRVIGRLAAPGQETPWPPFGLLAAPDGQPILVVSGDVLVAFDGEAVDTTTAWGWGTWQPPAHAAIQIGTFPHPSMIEGDSDFQAGMIASSGALVLPGGAAIPAAVAPPEPAAAEGAETEQGGSGAEHTDLTADLPLIHPMEVPADEPAGSPVVPSQLEPAGGPREPGGSKAPIRSLLWDNGERHPLECDVVIGRDPSEDPRVLDGSASGLVPEGSTEGLSRVHAEIRLSGWDVQLIDRGSTNGTFVWETAAARWRRLAAYESQTLSTGMPFAVAERTCLYEVRS